MELGDSYLASDATSSLMTVRRFIEQHLLQPSKESTTDRAYLAQHELFDQIPKLKEDIIVPDFCSLLLDVDEDENEENEENEEEGGDRKEDPGKVAINAWLGPCTTHSPLHYDCYYNILVQTVGYKYFRLYPAHVSQHLYPMTGKMCNNRYVHINSNQLLLSLYLNLI